MASRTTWISYRYENWYDCSPQLDLNCGFKIFIVFLLIFSLMYREFNSFNCLARTVNIICFIKLNHFIYKTFIIVPWMTPHPDMYGWKEHWPIIFSCGIHLEIVWVSSFYNPAADENIKHIGLSYLTILIEVANNLNRTFWPPSPHLQYYSTTTLISKKEEMSQMCNTFWDLEIFPYQNQLVVELQMSVWKV